MFINNAQPNLSHHMTMNCLQTYKDINDKGIILEQGLMKDGFINLYKENTHDKTQSNDKFWYWNKNKHTVTDGATNTHHVNVVGTTPSISNTPYQQTYQQSQQQNYHHNTPAPNFLGPNNQKNAISITVSQKPKFYKPPRVYTPIGKPLDVIFEKLAKDNLM